MNYNFCGLCNHELGQYEEAMANYNLAYKFFSKLRNMNTLQENLAGDILFNRGQTSSCLAGIENFKKSITDFESAYKQ